MEIIYGTQNRAKLASMQACLQQLPTGTVTLVGLDAFDNDFPEIPENGNSPLNNARAKALAYYEILKRPVFSCDSGLYFDGLPDERQPGVHIRRVNGKRLTDGEMTTHYAQLAREYGGRLTARYVNGICLVLDTDTIYEYMGDDIASARFLLVDTPHTRWEEGFPLDRLSVHIASGEYYYDFDKSRYDKEDAWHTRRGFRRFFERALASKTEGLLTCT